MKYVNLTPHAVNIYTGGKLEITIPPSEKPARIKIDRMFKGHGKYQGTPFNCYTPYVAKRIDLPAPKPNVCLIVSFVVRKANLLRKDLCSPGKAVFNDQNEIIGCTGLDFSPEHPGPHQEWIRAVDSLINKLPDEFEDASMTRQIEDAVASIRALLPEVINDAKN